MADKQYATKAPDVEMMSRKGEAIPLGAAVAYCESLPPERRVPRSGCYVYECGSVPVSCGYHFASDSCLSWNLTTVPFGCFAAPLGYENPTYVSLKRDVAMILVDGGVLRRHVQSQDPVLPLPSRLLKWSRMERPDSLSIARPRSRDIRDVLSHPRADV